MLPVVGAGGTTIMRLTCAYALRKIPLIGSLLGALLALVMNTRVDRGHRHARLGHQHNACVYRATRPWTDGSV